MKQNVNIAIVGLGQIGNFLLNELNLKKKEIETKTGKRINIAAISAKSINKKRKYKIIKKFFFLLYLHSQIYLIYLDDRISICNL